MSKPITRCSLAELSNLGHASPLDPYEHTEWYVCRTRARAEKKVGELLGLAGFEAYVPLVVRERQWADRLKLVAFPLFPGYVFVRFGLTQYDDICSTPGLVTVLRANGRPLPVRREELESVRLLAAGIGETGIEADPVDFCEPGDPVRITSGPFAGMTGFLLHRRGAAQVVVRLTSIRQALSVVLDRVYIKPVE